MLQLHIRNGKQKKPLQWFAATLFGCFEIEGLDDVGKQRGGMRKCVRSASEMRQIRVKNGK